MGEYVQLGEVRTWFEVEGSGDPLVLLHPGGADARAMEVTADGLAEHFTVYRPDRRGHGRTPDAGDISYELMARDTIAFLEQVVGGPAFVVAHSDGTPVALTVALTRPDLVRRAVFASGPFHHDGWVDGAIDLDEETIEFFTPWHEEVSPDGPGHFAVLAPKLHAMQSISPTYTVADLAAYPHPALVMVADDDEVRWEHLREFHTGLPAGQLCVVPGTGHGLLVERPELCNRIIHEFLTQELDAAGRPMESED